MAITTTNARYEGFIFDGENSRTYGVYVTDVEVFGAPVRNVEMISIPGRNGAFALDKGSYENIQVTYKCAMGCESQADFNDGISAFRNMLASRTGYKRLEDEINTDEYRMACFRGGISVPTLNKETATFDVVFDCKPQRYLKSGENEVSVASGGTISNPTLYDASPLLMARGSGNITINDDMPITIETTVIGNVFLAGSTTGSYVQFYTPQFNVGDNITLGASEIVTEFDADGDIFNSVQATVPAGSPLAVTVTNSGDAFTLTAKFDPYTAQKLDADASHITTAVTGTIEYWNGSAFVTTSYQIDYTVTYRTMAGGSNIDRFSLNYRWIGGTPEIISGSSSKYTLGEVTGYSTKSTNTRLLYFDLDIGEAYTYIDGELVSVNNTVTIPAKLPVLVPGENTITYDNTVVQFKVVPRWWQL